MPHYLDTFIIPIPTKNLPAYKKMAQLGAKVWLDHGALSYVESVLDDANPGFGLPFPKLAKTKPGQTVVVSYITYKSRAHRDRVNKLVMSDPRMTSFENTMPFNPQQMAYGGFKTIVEA